jgi:hypothetical protein
LVNLLRSDKDAVKIALTGTPLLREVAKEYDSKTLLAITFINIITTVLLQMVIP